MPVLGAIFSSARIYVILGALALVGAAFGYVMYLRAEASNARSSLASVQATVNEQSSVLEQNRKALVDLQAIRAADESALRQAAKASETITAQLGDIKGAINAIPLPKTCQALDPRDRAAVDGVRRIIGSPAAH